LKYRRIKCDVIAVFKVVNYKENALVIAFCSNMEMITGLSSNYFYPAVFLSCCVFFPICSRGGLEKSRALVKINEKIP
jgi:hypothetical protein